MGEVEQDRVEVIQGPPTANPRRTRVRGGDPRARNHVEQELSDAQAQAGSAPTDPEER